MMLTDTLLFFIFCCVWSSPSYARDLHSTRDTTILIAKVLRERVNTFKFQKRLIKRISETIVVREKGKACVFKSYLRGILSISLVFIYCSSLENKVGVFNFFLIPWTLLVAYRSQWTTCMSIWKSMKYNTLIIKLHLPWNTVAKRVRNISEKHLCFFLNAVDDKI